MKKITKAMIFAAGFGKRLVSLTDKTPKPLLQLNGKTLLENCILFLEDCGIKEIVINVHHFLHLRGGGFYLVCADQP